MKKENWEKEFDKRFEEPSGIIIGHKGVKDIKSFISQLLSLQKQEIVEEIDYNTLEGIICKQLGQYSEFNQLPNWDNIGKKSVVYDLIEVIKTHLKQTLTK